MTDTKQRDPAEVSADWDRDPRYKLEWRVRELAEALRSALAENEHLEQVRWDQLKTIARLRAKLDLAEAVITALRWVQTRRDAGGNADTIELWARKQQLDDALAAYDAHEKRETTTTVHYEGQIFDPKLGRWRAVDKQEP